MSCFAGPYNRGIVTNGLVLYYDVNEPVCYSSGRTDIQDLSRNGNPGTLVNGVGYSANNGGSLVFDGVNDWARLPLNSIDSNADFTLNFWNSVDNISGIKTLMSSQSAQTIQLRYSNASLQLLKNNVALIKTFLNFTTVASTIYLTTLTQVKSTNTFTLYINGNYADDVVSNQTFTISYPSFGLNYPSQEFFKGNIYSFSYYNRVLSTTEIQQNFNAHRSRFGI